MCFAPQRRALFRHLNFQKWSKPGVLCTFWLQNVLCATTACTFRQRSCKKCSEPVIFFYTFGLEMCFAPQRGASFHLSSGQLAPHPPLFDPLEPQIIRKTHCFATFLPFRAPGSSFFWGFLFFDFLSSSLLFSFSSLTLPISVFYLSILSEVWLLNFLRSVVSVNLSKNKIRAGNKRKEYIYIYIYTILYTIYIYIYIYIMIS